MRRRDMKISDAMKRLFLHGFVIVDTETTGTGTQDQVIQLGILSSDGDALMNEWFHPSCPVSPGAAMIHGRDLASLEGLPGFGRFSGEVNAALSGRRVVAYNSAFDSRLLEQTYRETAQVLPEVLGWHCAMKAAQYYLCRKRWPKLSEACEQLGVVFDKSKAHDALEDCRFTLAMMKAIAQSK